jgi:hypothetical protein
LGNGKSPTACGSKRRDETSMVDVPLVRAVLRALPERGAAARR